MKYFNEGDWVTYVNEHHPWHLMSFQVEKKFMDHNFLTRYLLIYGPRGIVAEENQVTEISNTNFLLKKSL